jgi:hypothetical protein
LLLSIGSKLHFGISPSHASFFLINIDYLKPTDMKKYILSLVAIMVAALSYAGDTPVNPYGLVLGKAELKSAGAITIGPDGILFVADPKGAAVFALDIKDNSKDTTTQNFEVKNIDKLLAGFLGIAAEDVVINDMVVQPNSQNIYLSVSRGRSADAQAVIIRVNRNKELAEVKTDNILFSKLDLTNVPGADEKTSWGAPKRPMAITDIDYHEGTLFVAGLSNEEFASKLRRITFPFNNSQANTSVEVFHTSHNRYETNSPIETLLPIMLNKESHVLAGYGCAPLAKFSLADLKEKKLVRGATLAELGGGSRPLDMILFKRKGEDHILIANSNRSVYKIKVADLEKSQPLTTAVDDIYVSSGTPFVATGIIGVLHIDDLNKNFVAAIQRDIPTGALNLVSIPKRCL